MTEANESISPELSESPEEAAPQVELVTPVVIELGKAKARAVKRLKQGRGRLMNEVFDVLDEITEALGDELDGKALVPVIMIYQKKKGRKRNRIVLPF